MQIEKHIPVPPIEYGPRLKYRELYEIVKKMKVGDSFIADKIHMNNHTFSPRAGLERKYQIRLTQRKTPEGIRIWRIS